MLTSSQRHPGHAGIAGQAVASHSRGPPKSVIFRKIRPTYKQRRDGPFSSQRVNQRGPGIYWVYIMRDNHQIQHIFKVGLNWDLTWS